MALKGGRLDFLGSYAADHVDRDQKTSSLTFINHFCNNNFCHHKKVDASTSLVPMQPIMLMAACLHESWYLITMMTMLMLIRMMSLMTMMTLIVKLIIWLWLICCLSCWWRTACERTCKELNITKMISMTVLMLMRMMILMMTMTFIVMMALVPMQLIMLMEDCLPESW